jgi:hypothetical protein
MIFYITRADFIEPSSLYLWCFNLLNEAFVKKQSYVFARYLWSQETKYVVSTVKDFPVRCYIVSETVRSMEAHVSSVRRNLFLL